ncbi:MULTISPECIES: S8 family serine peptidase [unclassified Salinibacterium]|uniref:S8 family serine peptidase n=1 Tax=unclassified Salinibacterium TaxID=2632331 RepID=UPI001CD5DD20|nr:MULTISPECIES: S8 family serine peptidase [unclassified Salinibacterium]
MRRVRFAMAAALACALLASLPAGAQPVAAAPTDAIRDAQYWLDDYGIRKAWTLTRGAGVTIAVIDTGVGDPPELRDAVVGGTDVSGVGGSGGRTPIGASSGHGTLVASLAAGRGTGATSGVIGSAPEASILAISMSFTRGDSDAQIADAVRWAVDNGADVINMSLTRNTVDWPRSWDEAFLYAAENDVIVVAAAGNRGSGTEAVGAPATMPGVLTVAGLDRQGASSHDASAQGVTIGVSAPSEDLVGVMPGGSYVSWNGTSGATPIVAGVVALVKAAHPQLDAANIIHRITATAKDAGEPGADVTYGYGVLDAFAAVTAEVPRVDANPMGDLGEWIRVNRPQEVAVVGGEPVAAPVEFDEPTDAFDPIGVLVPSPLQLSQVGAPLIGFLLVAFVLGGFGVGAAFAVRRAPRTR